MISNFLGCTKVLFQFEMIFVLFCPSIDWSIVAQTGVDCTNTVIATWLINDSQLLTPPPVINRSSMRTSQLLWRYVLSDCPFHRYILFLIELLCFGPFINYKNWMMLGYCKFYCCNNFVKKFINWSGTFRAKFIDNLIQPL